MRSIVIFRFFSHLSLLFVYQCITFLPLIFRFSFYITMDFLFQAGVGCIGFYAKYSPFGLFEKDKGPKVHPVSLGLQLHI